MMCERDFSTSEYVSAMKDSIGKEAVELASDYVELALDNTLEAIGEGSLRFLEGVPIVKTALGAYRAYRGISAHHYLKKLVAFINRLNCHIATAEEVDRYRSKFMEDDKAQNQQIEYLLIVIDRYVGCEKPEMLAALYLAFLDELITWQEFACYSETIDRFLPGDYEYLESAAVRKMSADKVPSALLRLVGLGLLVETNQPDAFEIRENGNISITPESLTRVEKRLHEFSRTAFGERLVSIILDARFPCPPSAAQ